MNATDYLNGVGIGVFVGAAEAFLNKHPVPITNKIFHGAMVGGFVGMVLFPPTFFTVKSVHRLLNE